MTKKNVLIGGDEDVEAIDLHLLVEKAMAITGTDLSEGLLRIGKILQTYLPFEYLGYEWYGGNGDKPGRCGFYRVGLNEYEGIVLEGSGAACEPTRMREPVSGNVSAGGLGRRVSKVQADLIQKLRMESLLMLPLDPGDGNRFGMYLASRQAGVYTVTHLELASRLQASLGEAIHSILGSCGQGRTKGKEEGAFAGIVGKNPLLLRVFDLIRQVAPMDSTVLILGESGTGKEKIAESIHRLSKRKGGPFVRINCAGFPPSLIESELFGHERGAFTGAMERRIGKFELATKGTIFLDEVGEMPLESQVKLLRVLQERQIERIGARGVTDIDIRIIAATNRNLLREVGCGRFRLDLYYRLNVFPIELPPLRDRTDDIGQLTRHFIASFCSRTGRKVRDIHPNALARLEAYDWPGNVRELEHVLERSLVLCRGDVLEQVLLPAEAMAEMSAPAEVPVPGRMKSLREFEREYLEAVLKNCGGRLSGKKGAATILGVPPSTLYSKLVKLGIRKLDLI